MFQMKCRFCDYEGETFPYAGFFPQSKIMEAHKLDPYMPKYGVHIGIDCPKCEKWQRWLKQDDELMLMGKFYLHLLDMNKTVKLF